MKYYEVTFCISPDSQDAKDILAAITAEVGFESFEECEQRLIGYVQMDNFDKTMLDNCLNNFPMPNVNISYEIKEAEDINWNKKWEMAGFEPIVIGNQCVIYDAKTDFDSNAFSLSVAIDAQQAFGTGTHETTQMIVSALIDIDMTDKRVLDCGCGTGILGIVAAKKGAKDIVGYDIDDWSVKNTMHNAELNNVKIDVLEGDKSVLSHINGVFDIILANINRNILLDDMSTFIELMNNSCELIISGFYESDAEILKEKAAELGLKELKRMTSNEWCCLILGKA